MDPMEGIEGPTESLLSMRSISASGSNLLLLLGMTIFLVWGVRLMRLVNKIYELNISIKAGNVRSLTKSALIWREDGAFVVFHYCSLNAVAS